VIVAATALDTGAAIGVGSLFSGIAAAIAILWKLKPQTESIATKTTLEVIETQREQLREARSEAATLRSQLRERDVELEALHQQVRKLRGDLDAVEAQLHAVRAASAQ
jgi:predicted  nucleic acid-binding Zn-ribbon protein